MKKERVLLEKYRSDRKITASTVAEAIGVSEARVLSWEQGKTSPITSCLKKLSWFYGIPEARFGVDKDFRLIVEVSDC